MNTPDYRTLRLGTNNRAAVAIISRYGYFVFFAVVMISGCDAPELPKIVTISKAPVFRPSSPQEIHTLEEAMATIITTCREHLALPVVDPLRVHLYKNTKSFGILFGRRNRMDVEEVTASAQGSDIHVNLEALEARPWREEVQLLAHEYTHGVHYTLAGRGDRSFWFVEGFAEWVAAKVLHALNGKIT
jgi:hypothetical protein